MLKNTILFFIFATLFLQADSPSRVFVGPLAHHIVLDSKGNGTFRGNIAGAWGGYEYMRGWGWYAQVDAQGGKGRLKGGNANSSISQEEFFIDGRIGYTIGDGKGADFVLVPYTGYSYHWVREHRHITGFTPVTYTYLMPFVPVGFIFNIRVARQVFIGLLYQYQFDIDTMLDISSLKGSYWKLKRKDDMLIEMPITYKSDGMFDFRVEPYYRRAKTGTSTAATATGLTLGIQSQKYRTWGVKFAFSCNF